MALRSVIECLAAVVAHAKQGFLFFDRPRRREAAAFHSLHVMMLHRHARAVATQHGIVLHLLG